MKEEMYVSALPRGIIIESILAPPNISAGEPLSNADTRESLAAQHVFTFVSLHVIITYNCCIVLKLLFFVVVEHLCGLVYVLVLCLSADCLPSLFPPPRQWRFYGKQFEHQRGGAPHSRHNAGTKRYQNLPPAYLHPDSPCSGTDHYHRCSDRYLSHTNLLHLTGRAFVLTQRSPPATVTISSTTPPTLSFQVSHRGYLCFYRDRLMRVKMTQHNCISMQEKQRRATGGGALNISTHGSVNLSWFCNISLIMDLIHVYSNSVNYKRKHPWNELHFWIEKWVSSSPHAAAKLGDTKELESFISMLDQELAGKGMTFFFFFNYFDSEDEKPSKRAETRRAYSSHFVFCIAAPLPPTYIIELLSSVNGVLWGHLHNLQW